MKQSGHEKLDADADVADDLAGLGPGLEAMCPEVTASVRQLWSSALTEYAALLFRWSGRVNLVAPADREHLVTRHILPSLALRSSILRRPHACILDVGSGAGLPGVPLKITLPESRFILLDSRRRRVTFLQQVVRQLSLTNTEVVHSRLEDWCGAADLDIAVARATMAPAKLVTAVSPFLPQHGVVVTTLSSLGDADAQPQLLGEETVQGPWGVRRVAVLAPPHPRG